MKRLLTLCALVVASASFSHAAVKPGEAAPDFKLPSIEGKTVSLDQYKGKYVVLEWTNYGCPFVKKHYDSKHMQGLQKEYTGRGVVWLSICSSASGAQGNMSAADWQKAATEKGVKSTAVLLDADGKVGHLYEAKTTPDMFVINPEGKLIYKGAIDSIPSPDQEDLAKATNYVKAALDSALDGKPVATTETRSYGCSVKYE